jgi:hypothetical protein
MEQREGMVCLCPEHEVARLPLEVARGLHVENGVEQRAGGRHALDVSAAATSAQALQAPLAIQVNLTPEILKHEQW